MQLVMKLKLKQAYRILENCAAVSTEDGALMYPSLSELDGNPENEFAYFEWNDTESGDVMAVKCKEENNEIVEVSDNIMTLEDTEGDKFTIYLLGSFDTVKFLAS
jgi:hypothetical protein